MGLTMGEAGSKVLAGPSGLVPATLLAPDMPGCANRTLQGPTSQAGVTVLSRCPWGWGPGQGESRTNCPLIVWLSVQGLELGLALGCGVCSPGWASLTCGAAAAGETRGVREPTPAYDPHLCSHLPRSPPGSDGTMPPSQPPRGRGDWLTV